MADPTYQIKYTLWEKVWKGLGALAMVFGLVSITGIKLNLPWVLLFVMAVIFLAGYWHTLELTRKIRTQVIGYFSELQEDIKFIKTRLGKKGTDEDE